MRIALLGHREIASNLALSLLASHLPDHDLAIFLSGDGAKGSQTPDLLHELESYETTLCRRLEPGAASPLWAGSGVAGFEALSRSVGRALVSLDEPNSEAGLRMLRDFAPDLIVSVRYRRILKAEAISIPRLGVINLHSGLLPEYQGAMATFWAMLAGASNMGWTLHYIVDGTIDTGPIIERQSLPIDYRRSYLRNVLSLYPGACARVVSTVKTIATAGRAPNESQTGASRYYSFPTAADLRRFIGLGYPLYTAEEIEAFVPLYDPG